MSEKIRFSILIPYHNSSETIAETIASIQAQDGASIEIIIADDRSNVTAIKTLSNFAAAEPRIRIIKAKGQGPSAARNTAAAAAQGELLCFLDADDCLRQGALNAYDRFLSDSPDIGVAFGQVRITEDPSGEGGIVTPYCPTPKLAQIIGENRICTTSNVVVRREAFADIGGFNEALSHAEDQEWLARAFLHPQWKIKGLHKVTLDYRTSPSGLSSDLQRMEAGWRQMFYAVTQSAGSISNLQLAEARGFFYRYLARRALRLGVCRADSAFYMTRALTAYPLMMFREVGRTWPTLIGALAVLCFGAAPFRKVFH